MISDSKKLLKTSLIYAAGQILVQGINFFLLPVYTNKLGAVEYGKISAISAFTGLFSSFIIISIQSGLCRFYQEQEDKGKIVSTALNFSYILCLFWAFVILIMGKPLSGIFFNFGSTHESCLILYITAATSMLNQIISIYISKYSMEYKAKLVSTLQAAQVILQFFVIILLVLKVNMGLMGVLYGQLFSAAGIFIIVTFHERKNYKCTIVTDNLKNMILFSAGLLPVNLSGWILTLSDRYFIKHYLGLADTGIYNLGYQFGMIINPVFITPFLNSFTAYKFETYKNHDAREKFKKLFRRYDLLGCFIMLGIAIYSKFGVMLFANREFLDAYKVVPLILYSYFLYGKAGYYALGFQIENKTWKIGQYMIYAAILNTALNFILVPVLGIYGAAISTLAAYLILDIIFINASNKFYKIDLDIKYQIKVQALTAAAYGIYYIISLRCGSIALEFAVNLIILALYVFLLFKAGLVDHELKMLIQKIAGRILKFTRVQIEKLKYLYSDISAPMHKLVSESFIDINKLDTSKVDREALEGNCSKYLLHCFNLLGSGWVKVDYHMECRGLEGFVYDHSLHIKTFDAQGIWLKKILRMNCLSRSRKIWHHIEACYIPIDWQMDFKSGFRYSQKKFYLSQPIGKMPGVDIKIPWELCRLQHLPQLAIAAIVFPEKRKIILNEFKNQVLDFIMANPVKMGAAWTCTMDTGIRAANLLVSYDIFRQLDEYNILDEYFINIFSASIYEHGTFITKNLEINERFTGNHYLADITGLLFISAYLKSNSETDSWLKFSAHELLFQGLKQFYADGSSFEASTSYHRLSGELLAYSTGLIYGILDTDRGSMLERDFFPDIYLERLLRAAVFTLDITKQNDMVCQIGDNDSGRLFKLSPEKAVLNHDAFISAVNGLFDCSCLLERDNCPLEKSIIKSLSKNKKAAAVLKSGTLEDIYTLEHENLNYLLKNEIEYSSFCQETVNTENIKLAVYPFFGLYIFKSTNFYLSVMAGGIGQNGIGGHSHNDKLSFELNLAGRDVCRDPGTYLYTPISDKRNMFRSIHAHNAPVAAGEEQCRFNGLFSMNNEVRCCALSLHNNNPSFYLTYRNIKIIREFLIEPDRLIINDKCNMPIAVKLFSDAVSLAYGEIENNL